MNLIQINTPAEYNDIINNNKDKNIVLNFWAEWCAPCKHMNDVFAQLSKSYPDVLFLNIDAEQVDDIPELFEVEAVPTFVFFKNKETDKLVGANALELANKVEEFAKSLVETYEHIQEALPTQPTVDLDVRLKQLTNYAPIMLFMKGTPDEPQCGFSKQIVQILKKNKVTFSSFNILSDNSIRQGLKEFSNWKTYPQLYVMGKLIGGLDIVKELEEDNELLDELAPGLNKITETESKKEQLLNDRLESLINTSKVMVFMKGTPDAPRCGFSSQLVGILNDKGVQFSSFNILADNDVRQGLKKYSDWPTYPQIYVNGKLIGGLDIVKEMIEDDEFIEIIPSDCLN